MKLDRWVRLEPGTNRLDFRTDPDLDLNLLVSFSIFFNCNIFTFSSQTLSWILHQFFCSFKFLGFGGRRPIFSCNISLINV